MKSLIVELLLALAYVMYMGFPMTEEDSVCLSAEEYLPLAEQGDADAQNNPDVIYDYDSGKDVLQDYKVAYAWFDISAVQDDENDYFQKYPAIPDHGKGTDLPD